MSHGFSFPNYGLFNATYYLQQNPDVATSWTGTPLQHYIQYGALEGRAPTAWFNADFYRASYPDLQSMNALQLFNHYCNYGFNEGRVPMLNFSNFNGVRYLLDNPDVAAAGYTATDAVSHYVVYGEYEGRVAYANNGVVIDPVVNEGELFTLTTGVDSIQGTQFNDTFDASQEGTLQNFDSLDGMGGTDTLYATLGYYNSSVTPMQLSNIEIISATANQNSTNATLNLINAGQVTNVNNNASTENLTVTNIAAGSDLAVSNTTFATRFDYASTTGTQSVDLAISEVTSNADITIAGVETINITSSGNLANVVDLIATSATTITAAGTAALDIVPNAAADLGAVTLIDGTNMSGALTATLSIAGTINGGLGNDALTGAADVKATLAGNAGNDTLTAGAASTAHADSMTGGLGNDTIVFGAGLIANTSTAANNDSIDGGLGIDTLSSTSGQLAGIDNTATGAIQSISGIEQITVSDTLVNSLTLSKIQAGINTVNLAAETGARTITFDSAVANATVNLSGTIDTAADFGVTAAGTATTDAVTIANAKTTGTTNVFNGGQVVATGYETLTLNGGVATAAQTLDTLTVNDSDGEAATVFVTGANAFTIASFATNNTGVQTIDASGLTATTGTVFTYGDGSFGTGATQSIVGSAGNDSIVADNGKSATVLGGAGNDTVTGGTAADSIDGGAGSDSLTGAGGNDTIHGGAGNDTIIETVAGTVSITGGDGDDLVNVGATLNTGDVLDGGSGVDTLAMSAALISPYANVTNFETLQLNNPGNQVGSNPGSFTQNLAFFTGTAFSTVELTSYQTVYNVSGLADAATVLISRNVGTPSSNERANNPTVLTHATDTANNTLSLGWYRDTTNANAAVGIVTVNDTNTLNFVQGQMDAAHTIEYAINAVQVTQINLTGDAGQIFSVGPHASSVTGFGDTARAITIDGSANTGLVIVDASTAIAGQNLTMMGSATAVNTLTGGAGNDSITGGAANDSLVGGAGNDTISGGAGNDAITGGDGADTINFGAGTDKAVYTDVGQTATDVVVSGVTVLTGIDTITNAGAGDVIDGNVDFSGTVGTSLITTGTQTAGTVAVVLGNYNVLTGIFTTSTTGADTLVQYCAGTADADIQDIVLVGYATAGAASLDVGGNLVIG